jgi:transposase
MKKISNIDPQMIVYSDETGIDDNEVTRTGWALYGQRCFASKRAERVARFNLTAALNKNKIFAPFVFEGYSNTLVYETYIERVLVPALTPGMVVVIDNASFHKSEKIKSLIQNVGCDILFLPPYSPDLNPIEHYWHSIKTMIRKLAENTSSFYDAAVHALQRICTA